MTIPKSCDQKLYDVWDKRWEGSEKTERLTFIGQTMFKAKGRALNKLLKGLEIQTVIEVGCGLGHTMAIYRELGLDCIGIDVSPHAVNVCRNKDLRAVIQKVEEVGETYDLVSCDGMLEHFLDFEPYAKHLMRISRRYVLLIQPNHESFVGKTFAYLAEIFRGHENVHEYNYRMSDFISVFLKNGFEITQSSPIFFDVFRLLLFEKSAPS